MSKARMGFGNSSPRRERNDLQFGILRQRLEFSVGQGNVFRLIDFLCCERRMVSPALFDRGNHTVAQIDYGYDQYIVVVIVNADLRKAGLNSLAVPGLF